MLATVSSCLLLASFALLAGIILATGMTLDWSGIGMCIAFSTIAMLTGLGMRAWRKPSPLADLALVLAVLSGGTVCNTLSMNAGLRLHLPLMDAQLLAFDGMLGFDTPALVRAFAASPWITATLGVAYEHCNWIAIVVVLAHCVRRTPDWEPFIAYAGGLLMTTILFVLFPAIGNIAHSNLFDLQDHGLPLGAGTYHLDAFRYYYRSTGVIAGNAHISGVGVFPSFHTIMGLVIATGLRGTRFHLAGAAFGTATIVATIPFGSHYIADIVGGTAVWVAAMTFARHVCSGAPKRDDAALRGRPTGGTMPLAA